MSYYRDLREYIKALESKGRLVRIKRPINKDTELQPLVRLQYRGLPAEERKAFLFENVTDSNGKKYTIPVLLGALAANRDIYALGMGCAVSEIANTWLRVQAKPLPPVVVTTAPCQQEVHLGEGLLEHGALEEFPIPISTPGYDVSPYITSPYWVSKDPDTGVPNLGTYRAQVKSPTRTGMYFSSYNKHIARHMAKLNKMGKKTIDAAIVLGGPPSLGYVSVTAVPWGLDEFAVCGAIAGEPLEIVKCKTVDLHVPAHAEIVIEGTVPIDKVEPEAPFGEALGYMGLRGDVPYFDVTCITHRKNPIWQGFFSQHPPSESSVIRGVGREGALFGHLRNKLQHSWVLQVGCMESTGSTGVITIKVGKTDQENVWKTLEESLTWIIGNSASTKILIAVDEDIDVHDADAVDWAISYRMQPHKDVRIKEGPTKALTDPSVMPPEAGWGRDALVENIPTVSRMMMNATMKFPYIPVSLPRKEFMERALEIWKEEKLPALRLKEPWYGYNLGFWPKEVEEEAQMAVSGRWKEVGERLAKQRKDRKGGF